MFCQYCGKQIDESADVCIGCGKFLKSEKKTKVSGKVYSPLSILVLVCSSVFCLLGMIAFFVGMDSDFFSAYVYENTFSDSWVSIQTNSFVALVVALIIEACSAIMSLMLLATSDKKVLNIVSWGISMGTMVFVGLLVGLVGV